VGNSGAEEKVDGRYSAYLGHAMIRGKAVAGLGLRLRGDGVIHFMPFPVPQGEDTAATQVALEDFVPEREAEVVGRETGDGFRITDFQISIDGWTSD
jgi:hypothetical protein